MSVDKLVDSTQLDADLTSVANAIRTKGGTSASLAFPAEFVSAIAAIPTGGGGSTTAASGTVTLAAKEIVPGSGQSTEFPGIALSFQPDVFVMALDRSSFDAIATPVNNTFYAVLVVKKTLIAPYRLASNVSTDSSTGDYITFVSSSVLASSDVLSNGYAVNGFGTIGQSYQPLWYMGADGKFYFGRINTNSSSGFPAGTYSYFSIKI